MDASDLDSGLFGISLSDSSDGEETLNSQKPNGRNKADRTGQSEAEFQAVRKAYAVKVENGEIWKTVELPLDGDGAKIAKPQAQALLHAVEELYFFRRYEEAAKFVGRVLGGDGKSGSDDGLDEDTRKLLRHYETKCAEKVRIVTAIENKNSQ
ncbi:uncharacterized protein BCR38DRAFT_425008 [Pseudomassariella vexata]|uniref:Uncharacterized protein n=1 Tax=Pseudomassariella vexata TaxID=1141098 RepID=A0A1Y2ECN1_9PEZI|nr:uncharacterized protein BCR38DRAFT_425008 [Pseudomassariella vexata]ORY68996.1 hypothetical protein BCR38DRAFT_425008 [Pseudomassariella vexata]